MARQNTHSFLTIVNNDSGGKIRFAGMDYLLLRRETLVFQCLLVDQLKAD
ncbi:MAG: hypothetical protein ACHQEM_09120 [Chitinophagales bacterium]